MYIWTVENVILNLEHFKRVDVVNTSGNNYSVKALTTDTAFDTRGGATIARFNNEADGEYCRCLLFNALVSHAGAWDATAIKPLTEIWQDIKKHFSSDVIIGDDLLQNSDISVTGLNEVTITYPVELKITLKANLEKHQNTVEEKLTEAEALPSFDIKWKSSDE